MDRKYSPVELMQTYLEKVGADGQLDLIDQIAQPDMIDEANIAFGGPPGREGLVAHVKGFRRNVTNSAMSIQKIVGGESEVMAWWSFTGVHSGPWMNIEPSHEEFSADVFSFFSLREGRIARYRLWLHAQLQPPVIFDSSTALALAQTAVS